MPSVSCNLRDSRLFAASRRLRSDSGGRGYRPRVLAPRHCRGRPRPSPGTGLGPRSRDGPDRKRFSSIDRIVTALKDAGFANVEVEERRYARILTPEQQLDRVRRKYLSTFDLIPADEYERGLRFLEVELPRRYPRGFEIAASFTFLGATR